MPRGVGAAGSTVIPLVYGCAAIAGLERHSDVRRSRTPIPMGEAPDRQKAGTGLLRDVKELRIDCV